MPTVQVLQRSQDVNSSSVHQTHQERFLAELIDFLRIPSISTNPQYAEYTRRAALFYGHYDVQSADPYELWEYSLLSPQ